MKTNEQIACNNWEKIGIIKGRKQILERFEKVIDEFAFSGDKEDNILIKRELITQIKKEMEK